MVCKTAQTAPSLASSQVSSTVTKDKRSEFSKKLRHQEKALNLSEKDQHQLKSQNSFVYFWQTYCCAKSTAEIFLESQDN